jgi:hypothetical protein
MKLSVEELTDVIVTAYERGYKDAATAVKPAQPIKYPINPNTTTWPEIRIGDVPPYQGIVTNNFTVAETPRERAETIVRAVREQLLKLQENKKGVQ